MTPKAWFCLCVPTDSPDGPARRILGPFPERELAGREALSDCDQSHIVVYGEGSEAATLYACISTLAYRETFDYYKRNPHEVPERCAEMLRELGICAAP